MLKYNVGLRRGALLLALIAVPLQATVKIALRYGATCGTCHISPTGAGMRSSYGYEEVMLGDLPRPKGDRAGRPFSIQLGPNLRWGADIRLQAMHFDSLALRDTAIAGRAPLNVIFPMQAAVYLHGQASESLDFSISYFMLQSAVEFWIRATAASGRAYLRAGQFLPAYGLRLDDHTSYIRGGNGSRGRLPVKSQIRQGLPFGPYAHGRGTVEGGLYFSDFYLSAHISTPSMAIPVRPATRLVEFQRGARLEWIRFVNPLTFLATGSYLQEGDLKLYGGGFGMQLSRFAALFEIDLAEEWAARPPGDTKSPMPVSRAIYAEFDVQLVQGLSISVRYDRFEQNTERPQKGLLERVVLGAEYFPVPHLEFKPQLRLETSEFHAEPALNFILQMHAFF